MCRVLFVILLAVLWLPTTWALTLPPLQGDVAGQMILPGFGDSLPLDWRVQAKPTSGGDNQVLITVISIGLGLEMELQVSADDGVVHWRIDRGEVELSHWWRPITTRVGVTDLPDDIILTGKLRLAGKGTWIGNQVIGAVTATVTDGTASSLTQNWSLSDLTAQANIAFTSAGPLVQTLQLRAGEALAAGIVLRNLTLDAVGDEQQRLTINRASVDALGGRLALRPFTLNPTKLEIDTTAEMEGVALGKLADFVPQALREASGQMSGRVAVRWSAQLGAQPGGGSLTVEPATPASIRLAATPGFLTQHATEKIQWLPDAFGPVARWLAVENPAYDTLRRIELGDMPLEVETLRVSLFPDGPNGARSAVVEVVARPATGAAVEKVSFTLNVSGPLDEVLRLGSDERVKLQLGAKP